MQLRYLDLVIRRERNRLVKAPHLKDPGLSRRLSRFSAHPHEIHRSWPKIMLNRAASLTIGEDAQCGYRSELTNRLINDGCVLPSWTGNVRPRCSRAFKDCPVFWLPLGYHPWWDRQIKKAVRRLNKDTSYNVLLQGSVGWQSPVLRLAWKNMLPNTNNLLQR